MEDSLSDRTPRRHYVRAHVTRHGDQFVARTTGNQGSNIMTSLVDANALVIVPESKDGIELHQGDTAKAIMLDWSEE
jgi:molybdopterin molybdotransferase